MIYAYLPETFQQIYIKIYRNTFMQWWSVSTVQFPFMWTQHENIDAVGCQNSAVQYILILHIALLWQQYSINQILNSQKTPHISSSRVSYGVSIVRML